ncbi:MAG TPA: S-adenosylmethionine decarboxylase [Thermoanaerobaculia bacterium]|jgi:S-adenosylmethionine decarboxylase
MSLGTEWLVDATGCDAATLRSVEVLERLFARVIAEVQLKPLHAPAFHVFPGEGGITGFVMLSESHLAIHTFPEHEAATINLYCCRPRPEWPWSERLTEMLGASDVRVRVVERQLAPAGMLT